MHMLIKQFMAGDFFRRMLRQHPVSIQKINSLAGVIVRRLFYHLIDAGVRPEGERVIIPGQFKFGQGLDRIGQREVTTSQAELQLGVLRIDGHRPGKLSQSPLIITRRFESDAILISCLPFCLLSFA